MNKIHRTVLAISCALTLGILSAGRILAETQVFLNDVIIDNHHVDRCIASYRFPDACGKAATREVAQQFCKRKGYTSASKWSWVDKPWKQRENIWMYAEEYRDGELWTGWKMHEGGFMFETIICER